MTTVGTGKHTYRLVQDWARLPQGEDFGVVSAVATDSEDRVYVFQRKDPPVLVFDREGNYLSSWGIGAITNPHGIYIADDVAYLTDRDDSVALKFTLDGKPLQVLGHEVYTRTQGVRTPVTWCPGPPAPSTTPQSWSLLPRETCTSPMATATAVCTASRLTAT